MNKAGIKGCGSKKFALCYMAKSDKGEETVAADYITAEDQIRLYDEDIREPLFDYLEERYGKIRIFEEKIIGRSRADILLLTTDSIIGIEIKSDADSYERLKRQVGNYNKYCDRNYIAVGKTHAKHVAEHVPKSWGILVVSLTDDQITISEMRPTEENPRMIKEQQITLLWRPELNRILEKNQLPRYKQKSKKFVQLKLLEKLAWEDLKPDICEELFERDYTLWEIEMEQYRLEK